MFTRRQLMLVDLRYVAGILLLGSGLLFLPNYSSLKLDKNRESSLAVSKSKIITYLHSSQMNTYIFYLTKLDTTSH